MRVFISWLLFGVLLVLTSFMVGCSHTIGDFIPNSHFAYPNSNVEPLGQVTAEVSKTRFLITKAVDKDFIEEVMNAALKEKGGDVLLNYKMTTTTTAYPFFITTTTLRLDGTAAKMTIGRKELR